ncbi:Mitochondrial intermediate peptidase [Blyttiomyces sp. JEL0837]|nr:Mitochondrial intermediate peptidase [Blyttiomyces sp. JEL0837]
MPSSSGSPRRSHTFEPSGVPSTRAKALLSSRRHLNTYPPHTGLTALPASTPLAQLFDSPRFWKDFNSNRPIQPTGLFGYEDLVSAKGFVIAAQRAITHAMQLVELIGSSIDDDNQLKLCVKRLDRLSDLICSVVDAAEVMQNIHPDPVVVKAANRAFVVINSYLNQLNTNQKLYETLQRAIQTPSVYEAMTSQERRVAQLLLADFEKSGIHMPDATRHRFVELNDRILELCQKFVAQAHPAVRAVEVEGASSRLAGVPRDIVRSVLASGSSPSSGGRSSANREREKDLARIPTPSMAAFQILKSARDEQVRKLVFLGMNSASKWQLDTLDEMLKTRGELARLLDKKSYAQMYLKDKMAQTPEIVTSFLNSLAALHKPQAEAEIARLLEIKRTYSPNGAPVINAWDRYFYSQFTTTHATPAAAFQDPFHPHHAATSTNDDPLSVYFTVGQTLSGISNLLKALYGVTFEPAPASHGETWHEDVRKLYVVHETEGTIGVVYCDLFRRERNGGRKYENAAQFTVRCSRRIDDDDDDLIAGPSAIRKMVEEESAGPVMRNAGTEKDVVDLGTGKTKKYQLPIVVLVTSFGRVEREGSPSLLCLTEVETLFHEMGHVMHSMLARTDLQHIAGTRCPMDYVEFPSNLFEKFARSPLVLSTFAKHYLTGQPLDPDLYRAHRSMAASADSLEIQHQLQLALLDQVYHSERVLDPKFDSTAALKEVQTAVNVVPFVEGTAWQVQFSHLSNYGANYYSYFWSRRWGNRVYGKLFGSASAADKKGKVLPWREAGEMVRRELLGWGGGRDPWVGFEKIGVVREGDREGKTPGSVEDLLEGDDVHLR